MSQTTRIHVTSADNELLIIASQDAMSSLLCHIKSGYSAPVDYSVNPAHILPAGKYNLTMIGINWGGPEAFKVTLTTGGRNTVYAAPGGTAVGATWTVTVPITI